MIRKRTEKVLAWLLTLALVVGSFVSFPAKAATSTIWEVKVQKTEISGKGGNVEVNVRGENLGSQVWYKISTKVDGMPVKLVDHTAVDCPGSNGGNIQIPIPANTGDTARKLTISITDTDNKFGSYVKADKEITQASASGSETPGEDKTELNKLITQAEGYNRSDYTVDSWNNLQTVLANVKKVRDNRNKRTDCGGNSKPSESH